MFDWNSNTFDGFDDVMNASDINDSLRITNQKKQYMYYTGDIAELREYLYDALSYLYEKEAIDNMVFAYMNITKKIINQLAVIYKEPAKRKILIDGKYDKKFTDYYNSLLPKDVSIQDKHAHRLAKLHNTALPMLTWDAKSKRFIQNTVSSWYLTVNSSDYINPDEVYYSREYIDVNGNKIVLELHHTDNELYVYDNETKTKSPIPGADSTVNPYGMINFIVFRIDQSEDFWGTGADLLVAGNEDINFYLTKMGRDDLVLGTAGLLFGINLASALGIQTDTLPGTEANNNTDQVKKVKGGRGAIINAETNRSTDIPPSLKYVSTNPQIDSVLKAIDWKIKSLALSYGLNPNSFSTDTKVESGFSRQVARYEQMEVRREDLYQAKMYEQARFNFIKTAVQNLRDNGYEGADGLISFPDNAELVVDFGVIEIPATIQDKWYDRKMRLQYGQVGLTDLLLEDNPDLTKEMAQEMIDKNLVDYKKYSEMFNLLPNEASRQPQSNKN